MGLIKKAIWTAVGAVVIGAFVFLAWAKLSTLQPSLSQIEKVECRGESPVPLTPATRQLKALSWNIEFLAGKNYVFFFDLLDDSGPDSRPSREDIARNLGEVVRVLRDENADFILLQEVDDGADRTDRQDQARLIFDRLPAQYRCMTSAFYWKAAYVPHPKIRGSTGMKLTMISKYAISGAWRHSLAEFPASWLVRQFRLKRAVQEARLPLSPSGSRELTLFNTHLEAFAQGADTMQKQVARVKELVEEADRAGRPWLAGGDFNLLLPGGKPLRSLGDAQKAYYRKETELAALLPSGGVFPSVRDANGPDSESFYTHFPNDPSVGKPDRTIDYFFYASETQGLKFLGGSVRKKDTLRISDHFPVVVRFRIATASRDPKVASKK